MIVSKEELLLWEEKSDIYVTLTNQVLVLVANDDYLAAGELLHQSVDISV